MAMLTSLFENNRMDIDIYLFHSKLEHSDLIILSSFIKQWGKKRGVQNNHRLIEFKFDEERFSNIKIIRAGLSIETFYRLDIASVLSDHVDRILYLDGDIIVNRDISKLYYADFKGKSVIACKDYFVQSQYHNKSRIGLHTGNQYFNAGVLLINTVKYKEFVNKETVDRVLERKRKLIFYDQDILNILLDGQVRFAKTYKYNYMVGVDDSIRRNEVVKEEPYIIHYAGNAPSKPWEDQCLIEQKYDTIFWKYAEPIYGKMAHAMHQIKNKGYRLWRMIIP